MLLRVPWRVFVLLTILFLGQPGRVVAENIRIATYNLENYLDVPEGTRPVKSAEARAKVVESITALKPDIIAMQEVGSTNALLELQAALTHSGLKLPYWELVQGPDTNIHVAVLSRLEIIARRHHTNETYLLGTRRFRVSRGIAEVDVRVGRDELFTLIAVHLKSRNPSLKADESEIREQEAEAVRRIVDERLAAAPDVGLVVVGDFNDRRDSGTLKAVIGRGRTALFDTHPSERNPECPISGIAEPKFRQVAWTYYFFREDTYSRIDYILLNREMKRHWIAEESYVLALPGWGIASDHRPVVCTFSF